METKEFKIVPPEGYEIDKENSTFECIKFKPKNLTYEDVAKIIFSKGKDCYYIKGCTGCIEHTWECSVFNSNNPNNATSEKQLRKLFAINKLMNVAKYLNGNQKFNWEDPNEEKFTIAIDGNAIIIHSCLYRCVAPVYFKSKQFVQLAINILGEDTIRLALSTDY